MSYKIVYNSCYGGFSLSLEAVTWLEENAKDESVKAYIKEARKETESFYLGLLIGRHLPRHHKDLVSVVETLGDRANGDCSRLQIEEISGNQYRIEKYDGAEDVIIPDNQDWIVIEE